MWPDQPCHVRTVSTTGNNRSRGITDEQRIAQINAIVNEGITIVDN